MNKWNRISIVFIVANLIGFSQTHPLPHFVQNNKCAYISPLSQAPESTVHQSGSASTGTMGGRQPSGRLACCFMTWCAATSPLSKMRRSLRDVCSLEGKSLQVWLVLVSLIYSLLLIIGFLCSSSLLTALCKLFSLLLPPDCQQLIKWCLSPRPSDRPTLEQIFDHPWMRATSSKDTKTDGGGITLHAISPDSSSSTNSSKESLWWTHHVLWGGHFADLWTSGSLVSLQEWELKSAE